MTWIVATLIILLVILVFVFLSSGGVIKSSSFSRERLSVVTSEQMLLALMKTDVEGKSIKEYILDGEYDELENKIKPISKNLPGVLTETHRGEILNPRFEFNVLENEKLIKNFRTTTIPALGEFSKVSMYLDSNKKIEFYADMGSGGSTW